MSDVAGAAPAAADSAPVAEGAPITEGANLTAPLGSQIPAEAQAKPEAKSEPKSIDDSIDRAMAKSAAASKEKPVEAKEPAKAEQPRENGKFVAKEAKPPVAESAPAAAAPKVVEAPKPSHTAEDAPARFTETAKAKWASADPEIRGEVLRMHKELTQGYEKHKAAAERDSTLNEFHEMAKRSGKELPNVVREYVNMENHLRQDLVGGLDLICQRMGVSIRDVAAHVMGQTPDQNASKQDATIRELKAEIADLKGQVGNVSKTFQQQQATAVHSEVQEWAKDKPLFEVLAPHIADHMRESGNTNLDDAYQAVLQKHPQLAALSAPKPEASAAPAPAPAVQPDKGQKSINGAPSSGSSPAAKKRAARSLDDALDHAFGSLG